MNKETELERNKELNFTEYKIMEILEGLIFSENLDITGEITDELIGKVQTYICNNVPDHGVILQLEDYCNEIADEASSHAYKIGFKEGVRLFRTLMTI